MAHTKEPLLWGMFSAGGMLSALVLPAHLFLLAFAVPLGWVGGPDHAALSQLLLHPVARLYLFALVVLSLFHWGHRFRYTLYDGLQLYHLNPLIAAICYGGATILSLIAAYLLFL